jgi:hypothetical protein
MFSIDGYQKVSEDILVFTVDDRLCFSTVSEMKTTDSDKKTHCALSGKANHSQCVSIAEFACDWLKT